MKVAIIGSGIAGIAASIRMKVRGHQVDVYESAPGPGGKLSEYKNGPFRFDAGPSLFTMPQYVEELFELSGKQTSDYFEYYQLETICHYFWEDGTMLKAFADKEAFFQEVEEKLGIHSANLRAYMMQSKRKYELTGRIFLEKSLHEWSTWMSKDVIKALLHLPSFEIFDSMNDVHEKRLKDPKLIQFYNRFATYNGSNPYQASGMLTIIPYLEQGFGAYLPKGGMISISRSLYELGKDLGVAYHFNQKADKIKTENNKVSGIEVAGSFIPYDLVICNMDVFLAYTQLLKDEKKPEKILKQEKSSSALIFYWGINQSFDNLDVHNIFFSNQYKKEFEHISKGTVFEDPTVYINITSKLVKEDAPVGSENWFTMINVPYNSGQDWDKIIATSRSAIKGKLSNMLRVDVEAIRENELILEPRSIESKTQSHLGALYGTSSNDRMAAFFRHPNFSPYIKNLFFCGGSAHPGGGIPLSLLSAKIVDELIHKA